MTTEPNYAFLKATKPVAKSKAVEFNPFLEPLTKLNTGEWDAAAKESTEAMTVVVHNDDVDKVNRQLIAAGKEIDRSVRKVWSDIAVDTKDTKDVKEHAKTHQSVTFWPREKITRPRTPAPAEAAPTDPEPASE